MNAEAERARIYWRCRRGTRELDLVLMGFFKRCYDALPVSDKDLFAELLSLQDPTLGAWLLAGETTDVGKFASLVGKITAATDAGH